MSTPTDVVICLDNTSSIKCDYGKIRTMIWAIFSTALEFDKNNVRIAVIKFRSNDDFEKVVTYGFTQKRTILKHWLNVGLPDGGSKDGYEAVGDALHEALDIEWQHDNNEVLTRKLVILITDSAPNGLFTPLAGIDPWVISKKLKENNINLVVVGTESVIECDDFYCALAQITGGIFIPLINAKKILTSVIQWVIDKETTFSEAFRCVSMEHIEKNSSFKYSHIKDRVNDMIEECQTIADIKNLFFSYLLPNKK